MADRIWTSDQQDAIFAKGGSLLVSAAAGSGKTAVLVERAVQLICNSENPVSVERLLVVTFSNAAAAEMKQRMASRISALCKENPTAVYLQRQLALLSGAQISTVHSFCLQLIRENFQNLNISPDFSIADTHELELLREDCARECVENFYQKDDTGEFIQLVELISSSKDDRKLIELVLKIYDFCRSHPFFEDWLDDKLAMYDAQVPALDTIWGRCVFEHVYSSLSYCINAHKIALETINSDEKMIKAYANAFTSDIYQMQNCFAAVCENDWDKAVALLRSFTFAKLGPLRGEDSAKSQVKAVRDRGKKLVLELAGKYLNATMAEFSEDIADLQPKIKVLFELVKQFSDQFTQMKSDKRRLDFSDLEHLAISLLIDKGQNGHNKSEQAQKIAAQFDYVLVDEYQDTNEAQDLIFTAVSRNQENLFMVGDVKQSIYSFRQAMPEIFMAKKKRFFPYSSGNFPAKIILDKNFRSRNEVTQGVNFLFGQLMSTQLGEIDYSGDEYLQCGAQYPHYPQAQPEFLLIESSQYVGELDNIALEASVIADKICSMIESGYLVWDKDGTRPAQPKDFCILIRSPKNRAGVYVKQLAEKGVTAWAENADGYLQAREVSMVLCLLKAVDNPLLDIELVSAMLSPLFDFSDDDVAAIRLCQRSGSFFTALTQSAEEGNVKAQNFLSVFHLLRTQAGILPADKLIMQLYDITGAISVVQAMKMGVARKANLMLLVEYAANYHRLGYKKLAGFISFISRLQDREKDLSPASTSTQGAGAVTIMSIHRSKGLEYPIVIVADLSKNFNKVDLRSNTLLHSRYGFACVRRDSSMLKQYSTIPMQAIRLAAQRSLLSEEMRILYVALTRAKEKLIVTATIKGDLQKKISALSHSLVEGRLPPFVVAEAASYCDWMIMALLHHPSADSLRQCGRCEDAAVIEDKSSWAVKIIQPSIQEDCSALSQDDRQLVDQDLLELVRHRVQFTYPHINQTLIPTKLAVSALAKGEQGNAYRFTARPKFLTQASLTGAEKGNALHKFMQLANYTNARNDLSKEILRMRQQEFLSLTEVNSLQTASIKKFFTSKLAQRIFASEKVYRELKFTAECGQDMLGEMISGMDAQSKIVLQGVCDCVFMEDGKAVIVDYKTDFVQSAQQLKEKYETQLLLYKKILSQSFDVPIGECILYSFCLSDTINV